MTGTRTPVELHIMYEKVKDKAADSLEPGWNRDRKEKTMNIEDYRLAEERVKEIFLEMEKDSQKGNITLYGCSFTYETEGDFVVLRNESNSEVTRKQIGT